MDTQGPNPSGKCMCGCGEDAPIAGGNDPRYGIIKGKPSRYIKGHQKFKSPANEPYRVDPMTGCWVWQRSVNSSGYGHLYVDGIHKYAHVHYYEQAHGTVENNGRLRSSNQVHHLCGNKLCVNPEHLEVESVHDHRVRHGITKLTATNIEHIRDSREVGETTVSIGDRYGVSQAHISAICNRKLWDHIA